MKIDSNPRCDKFDISLYYKSILLTDKYNSKLVSTPILREGLKVKLKGIKDIRNDICNDLLRVPEEDIHNYANDLESLLNSFLDLIGNIFECKADTNTQKLNVQISIRKIMRISRVKRIIKLCI